MQLNNIGSRSKTALLWGIGGSIGKVASQFIVQITLARLLGPETFGQFAIILTILSLGNILADCGFGAGLIQKKKITSNDISLSFGWSLLIASFVTIIIWLIAPFLAKLFTDESLYWLITASAFLIVPQAFGNISTNLLQRNLNMKFIQIIHVFSYIVCFGGVAITLALYEWGAWSLVIGYGVQTFFKVIVTYSICRHSLRISLKGDRQLINFGLKALANDILNWAIENFDKLIIGRFWGLYSLGLYSVAFNLTKAPLGLFIYTVQTITFSTASRLQDNNTELKHGFLIIITAIALITIPFFSIIAYESTSVLQFVYGNKWITAAPYMAALAVSIPFMALGSITAAILRGKGEIGIELIIQLVTVIILFVGFYNLRGWTLEVAVWIVPASFLIRLILLLLVIKNKIFFKFSDFIETFRGALVLAALGICVTASVSEIYQTSSPKNSIGPILAGTFACISLLIIKFNWIIGKYLDIFLRDQKTAGLIGHTIRWLQRLKKCE
ncbi:MAG: lipopolysaccharide biosynthesis protein [Polaromonas sp.]|nr:lipopolysaccharide biosynthesis protein [Polaromonas sp.]